MANAVAEMMKTLNGPEDIELSEEELMTVTGGVDYSGTDIDWDNFGSGLGLDDLTIESSIKVEHPNAKTYKGGLNTK